MKHFRVKINNNGELSQFTLKEFSDKEVDIFIKEVINFDINLDSVDLIVYDFDGVLTDNKVLVDQHAKESVAANRSDGLAVSMFSKLGINQIIISTEVNEVVARRAEKIKIPYIHGVEDKLSVMKKYLSENKINKDNVIFVGNDLNDKSVMEYIGIPVAPADAATEIIRIAKIITQKKGGEGVVRELFDILTK
jgi:3-deoxy-D-manno-octulosonate 8-phosphate phosphatase (KDO 8-P phosphatase)